MSKLKWLLIISIVALGFFLRTYKITEPLGDWHSWRQADTASVALEYVKAGKVDFLSPRYHDLSSIPSGLDNPNGYRYVEFPLRDALHAYLSMLMPNVDFVVMGRLISIFFSSLTILIIYLIVRTLSGTRAGLLAAFVYATLPYSIFYGRVILPEPFLVFFTTTSLYLFLRYWETRKISTYFALLVCLTIAILTKPTALMIMLPIGLYALPGIFSNFRRTLGLILLPLIAIIPYALWRQYIASFPAGIPANTWLFNGNGIRLKGAWFRWLFGERIGKLILGYYGLIPFGFGLFSLGKKLKETLVYGGLVLACLTYLVVIATGNVQHDYYQAQIMPTIAILVGVGFDYMLRAGGFLQKFTSLFLGLGIYLLALSLGWYEVRGYFWVNNRAMVIAGQRVKEITPKDSLIIAPYMGDTAFLFQTNRRGWPIGGDIEGKIKGGASYYVTTTKDQEFQSLKSTYKLIEETDDYAIIMLKQ